MISRLYVEAGRLGVLLDQLEFVHQVGRQERDAEPDADLHLLLRERGRREDGKRKGESAAPE